MKAVKKTGSGLPKPRVISFSSSGSGGAGMAAIKRFVVQHNIIYICLNSAAKEDAAVRILRETLDCTFPARKGDRPWFHPVLGRLEYVPALAFRNAVATAAGGRALHRPVPW